LSRGCPAVLSQLVAGLRRRGADDAATPIGRTAAAGLAFRQAKDGAIVAAMGVDAH
jgi:hypothetical protein